MQILSYTLICTITDNCHNNMVPQSIAAILKLFQPMHPQSPKLFVVQSRPSIFCNIVPIFM